MPYKLGFIGTGNMGGAMAVAASRSIDPKTIVLSNRSLEKAETLAAQIGCATRPCNAEIAEEAEYIVIAVKPHIVRSVVKEIAPALAAASTAGQKRVLISLAAGVPIEAIKDCLISDLPVIRVMPNTPVTVGRGMILYTSDMRHPDDVSQEDFEEFRRIFAFAGLFEHIDEGAFDYTMSVAGCTPAYAYMFIEALADGAVQVGVPRAQAMRLAAQAVLGSAAMVLETGRHPGALKDAVCSPGGSTIAGVAALEEHGFRGGVMQAVVKSTEKGMKLGK